MFKESYNQKCDPDPYQGGFIGTSQIQTKAKPTFSVSFLAEKDIPAFLQLQQKVWDSLAASEKHFLKLRTEDDLKTHMDARMPLIGIKNDKGALVAQCIVAYPHNSEAVKNLDGYPINGGASVTAIIQSLSVDPDYAGLGLSHKILDTAKDLAAMAGHVQILSKVADDNVKSGKSFLNNAFTAASHGLDPKQGYPVTYWHYPVYPQSGAATSGMALNAKLA